ncbi:hypothetical protein K458DRAFT_468611 [Lentithecium fluviatile CBS 122367]|uniref:Uncharacterized protein n=1 Tax=Lentithecium fluviatile CBS 122367 TaxID=1168545 RepID=A0A6G1IDY4_9PLEO|nr:hypothetical protein K458DRAFT_468611 [Lentithecium fluviatile CBS 122367]
MIDMCVRTVMLHRWARERPRQRESQDVYRFESATHSMHDTYWALEHAADYANDDKREQHRTQNADRRPTFDRHRREEPTPNIICASSRYDHMWRRRGAGILVQMVQNSGRPREDDAVNATSKYCINCPTASSPWPEDYVNGRNGETISRLLRETREQF